MKILITGAAGLIGSHLADILYDYGHHVICVDDLSFGNEDNCKHKLYKIDVSTQNFLDSIDKLGVYPDVICHLAAYKKAPKGSIYASDVMIKNFKMMENVLTLCEKTNARLLFTSTSDVYGNSNTFLESDPITIGPPTNERYSYAMSKLHDEQLMLNCISEGNVSGAIARIFGCASPRSNIGWSGGHIPMFIWKALHNEDIIIHGDGTQTRSISHAIDIADGLASMVDYMDSINGETYNLGTNEQMSVIDAANMIIDKTNSKSKIIFKNREEVFGDYKEIEKRFANIKKANMHFNFKIKHRTEYVINEIIEVFKTRL